MIVLLLILAAAAAAPRPHAPNAVANRKPYYRFDPAKVIDRDPKRTAAIVEVRTAIDSTYRADFSNAELQVWCDVKVAIFELERKRK